MKKQSNKIVDVFNHIDDKTLVIFDIDNTLIEAVQEFGSYAWMCSMTSRLQKKGWKDHDAMQKTTAAFAQIEEFVEFKAIEPETLDVIDRLQSKNIKTMALTMRLFSIRQGTLRQLTSVNIKFSKNAVHDKEIEFDSRFGFSNGVLYSGLNENKGECLITFLERINYSPAHVLFVDDGKHHIDEMHKTLNAKGIPTTCIHYGAADLRTAQFDPARADKDLLETIGKKRFNSVFKEFI